MASYFFQLLKLTILVSSSTLYQLNSVQSLIRVWLFVIPWTAALPASLSITVSRSLLRLMSIESVMPCNHLILCHTLLPPSILPSIRVFLNESVLHIRWSKCRRRGYNPWLGNWDSTCHRATEPMCSRAHALHTATKEGCHEKLLHHN